MGWNFHICLWSGPRWLSWAELTVSLTVKYSFLHFLLFFALLHPVPSIFSYLKLLIQHLISVEQSLPSKLLLKSMPTLTILSLNRPPVDSFPTHKLQTLARVTSTPSFSYNFSWLFHQTNTKAGLLSLEENLRRYSSCFVLYFLSLNTRCGVFFFFITYILMPITIHSLCQIKVYEVLDPFSLSAQIKCFRI